MLNIKTMRVNMAGVEKQGYKVPLDEDLADLFLEDSAFCLHCLLKYLSSSSKTFGFLATNSAIRAMASSFAGLVFWDSCSLEMLSC